MMHNQDTERLLLAQLKDIHQALRLYSSSDSITLADKEIPVLKLVFL